MKVIVLILLTGCLAIQPTGQSESRVTTRRSSQIPRLEVLARRMSSKPLSDADQRLLVSEIVRTFIHSARETREPLLIGFDSSLWTLLLSTFPGIRERKAGVESEASIGFVTRYLNSIVKFQPVIMKVLQEERENGKCIK